MAIYTFFFQPKNDKGVVCAFSIHCSIHIAGDRQKRSKNAWKYLNHHKVAMNSGNIYAAVIAPNTQYYFDIFNRYNSVRRKKCTAPEKNYINYIRFLLLLLLR